MKPKRRSNFFFRRFNFLKGRFILQRESVLIFKGVFFEWEMFFWKFCSAFVKILYLCRC